MASCKCETLDLKALDKILISFGEITDNDLIPILQGVQDSYGYLPKKVLLKLSEKTGIPASRIYGVSTFYEQFHLKPHGKHIVRCCRGTACHVRGGLNIIDAISRHLAVEPGRTTEDMRYTFETVACLGTCFLAPVIMVNNDYHGHLTGSDIPKILERYE